MRADVIAIGDELTTGQRLDTNSQWISRELGVLGIAVGCHVTVPDDLDDGIRAVGAAADRADLLVITGGLGPTADDLTRDVLAAVAGTPLEERADALATVESRFARRGVVMPETNRRQALFPRGSRMIPNPEGTAPGLDVDLPTAGRVCRAFALPGVPAEMRLMWRESVVPALLAATGGSGTMVFRRIKCFGLGESAIEARLPDLVRRGRDPLVGITAHEATITLRIAARGTDEAACRARIAPTEDVIRDCLGSLVFGVEDDEIEDAALAVVAERGGSLATVEWGTCGMVAALASAAARRRGDGVYHGGTVEAPGRGPGGLEELVIRVEECRRQRGATHALGVGPVHAALADGTLVDIVLTGAGSPVHQRHRLGGDATIRLPRAARFAFDLVRTTVAVAGDRGDSTRSAAEPR
ncbi:MAG: competence/damage-inducible protein A [Pirellulales bacterium]